LRAKKPKLWLTENQTETILFVAKVESEFYYMIFLLCRWGLRIGEIVGRNRLPGIYVRDIRERGFWILTKKDIGRLVPVPSDIMGKIRGYVDARKLRPNDKLFPVSERTAEAVIKRYARAAGIEEWRLVTPHRLRAFLATDAKKKGLSAFEIRDVMRHANISTTNLYVGHDSPEEVATNMDRLAGR
jgi:integrase